MGGVLKFKGLPPFCKIRIYTVSGELVIKLKPEGDMAFWDGNNKDGSPSSMGSYVYIIERRNKILKRGKIVLQRR